MTQTSKPATLWTASVDYYGQGEGRTRFGWIGYAVDREDCLRRFGEACDPYFAKGADCAPGVVRNEVTRILWSEEAFQEIEKADGRGNVIAFAELHFNFS